MFLNHVKQNVVGWFSTISSQQRSVSLTYMADIGEGIVYIILNQRYFQGIKILRHRDDVFQVYCGRLEKAWGLMVKTWIQTLSLSFKSCIILVQSLTRILSSHLQNRSDANNRSTSQGCCENQRRQHAWEHLTNYKLFYKS